jgi:hypothetical protein
MTKRNLTQVSTLLLALLQLALTASVPAVEAHSQGEDNPKMATTSVKQSPLACNVRALNQQQRERIRALLDEFSARRQEVKELPRGYAIRLPAEASMIHDAAEFITLERVCCPFFDFALESEREGGPIWLTQTGREGVKELARIEFGVQQVSTSNPPPANLKESPLICNDGALSPAQLARLVAVLKELRSARQETRELPDGYSIRLPVSTPMIQDVAEFMAILRLCSPYFEAVLQVECEGGPLWLRMTGRQGVKELIKADLGSDS